MPDGTKMLALTPKLRAAKTDAERQTLQNAVTATDQQVDALVYELYGLTPEEIALVEREKVLGYLLNRGHRYGARPAAFPQPRVDSARKEDILCA
jgi:hypothetical protein